MIFDIVEKKNHGVIHASFATREEAERFLTDVIPTYVTYNTYCLRKGLSVDDFEIAEGEP